MEKVDNKNQVSKKRGRPHDEGFAARKRLIKARMAAHGFTYRSFSAKYGFSRGMINAAINETRESELAHLILRTINSLPLPGEGATLATEATVKTVTTSATGSQANAYKEMCL